MAEKARDDVAPEEVGAEPEAVRVKRPRERAAEWLKEQLACGPRKAAELFEEARKRGIPEKTLKRAKQMIRVRVYQTARVTGLNEWTWSTGGAGEDGPKPETATPPRAERPSEGQEIDKCLSS